MNQDSLKKTIQTCDHSEKADIELLHEYAKKACKKCYGVGYRKYVRNTGMKTWVTDHYEICTCVMKNENLEELAGKLKHNAEERKKSKEKQEVENILVQNTTEEVLQNEEA